MTDDMALRLSLPGASLILTPASLHIHSCPLANSQATPVACVIELHGLGWEELMLLQLCTPTSIRHSEAH